MCCNTRKSHDLAVIRLYDGQPDLSWETNGGRENGASTNWKSTTGCCRLQGSHLLEVTLRLPLRLWAFPLNMVNTRTANR